MAHTCNPCSSGVRDQEDHGTKPAQGNSSWVPNQEKSNSKNRIKEVVQVVRVPALEVWGSELKTPVQKRLFFLVGLGFELVGSVLAKQVLYHLSHTSSPFFLRLYWRSSLTKGLALNLNHLDLSLPSS
jgi:hypothetical protein